MLHDCCCCCCDWYIFLIFSNKFVFLSILPDIQNKTLDVVEFLEAFRPFVLATSPETRAKGVQLFSLTLVELPNDFLSTEQVEPITTFYCDRMKDHHSVLPSTLIGLEALVKMTNLPDAFSAHILRAMFENVTCQSQQRQDRATIFRIMANLCNNKTKGNLREIRAIIGDRTFFVRNSV